MRRHWTSLVAGAATLLAAAPLSTVFASFHWMYYAVIAVAAVIAASTVARVARAPIWLQFGSATIALLLFLTWAFPSGHELAGILPTPSTFSHFGALLSRSAQDIRNQSIPVPDLPSLLLLTTVGVGVVAIFIDLFAVGLRRPALAGLPMLAIYSVPVAVLPDGLSLIPFGFAAAGFLWLLISDSVDRVRRFGRRFTGDGRDIDTWEPSPLAAAGRRLGLLGVTVAIVLPLAVPGMTSGLIDRFGVGDGTGPGLGRGRGNSGSVDLFALLSGDLVRDRAFNMVHVVTDDSSPFYLRFAVADKVEPKGFVNRGPEGGTGISQGLPEYTPAAGTTAQQHHAKVEILNFDMALAPTFQQLTGITGLDQSWIFDPATGQVYSRRATSRGKTYEFDYVHVAYSPNALRRAGTIPVGDPHLALASVPPVAAVNDLVNSLIKNKSNQYDRVRAIYDHFSPTNGFAYRLRAPQGTSGHPIVDFLNVKEGFCVQYSAAMAWLVRAAGYPARVAFGFTRGTGRNGDYTLTNFNLHAWTEVYFPTFGWVPFDATPAGAVVGSVPTAWAPDPTVPSNGSGEPVDTPGRPTPGPTLSAGPDLGVDPVNETAIPDQATKLSPWLLFGAGTVVLLIGALLAPMLRRRALRRRRRVRAEDVLVVGDAGAAGRRNAADPGDRPLDLTLDPARQRAARQDAHACWAELLDTMIDYSITVDSAETPRATARRLVAMPALADAAPTSAATSGSTSPVAAHVTLLALAEERARYASTPLRPDGLDEAVSGARRAIRAHATRRQRLLALLMPRSVLLRWRGGWFGWTSRGLATTSRIREAVAGLNPARLVTRGNR